jgi:hypothetical protein
MVVWTSTGVVIMTNISRATRSHLRNLLLCTAVAFGLAACGGEDGASASSSTASAADPVPSLVSPNMGLIDRSAGGATPNTNTTNGAQPVGSNTGSTTPSTGSPTTTTPGSGTVASNEPPVRTTPVSGSATLDWMPPTENSDGTVLTNLAGYTVYYGTSPSNLNQSVKISNPGLTAYTVTNLPAGTWYFAVTSYSSAGVESSRTGTVSTTI